MIHFVPNLITDILNLAINLKWRVVFAKNCMRPAQLILPIKPNKTITKGMFSSSESTQWAKIQSLAKRWQAQITN